ncbi:hypothetical protein BGP_2919 [Beggiatoa sp. PS]|nr:hypothetical protein BGP_2919 [Beggiatoa sp. PS]
MESKALALALESKALTLEIIRIMFFFSPSPFSLSPFSRPFMRQCE